MTPSQRQHSQVMPFIAPCGHAYSNTPATTLILADERKKMYIGFCCAASGKPEEEFVCMNVKTIEKNLKVAKSLLPFASRTVQSSLPPKLREARAGTRVTKFLLVL